jgi:RNA polymerase sigma-70 factor (ECF subfamily)
VLDDACFDAFQRELDSVHRSLRRFGASASEVDPGPGPEEELQSKQARTLVLAALDRILLPRRAVLVMHDLDDVPVTQVASILSIPLFTVYSRLRKARRELDSRIRHLWRGGGDG